MKPPVCIVCRKRFDPSRSELLGGGGLVHFTDYRPQRPDGPTGHPAGAAWFCGRHYPTAKTLQDRPLGRAMALFRRRQLLRLASWLGAALVATLAGAAVWNVVGPVGLGDASDVARGRFSEGRLAGHEIDARGAGLAAHWVETRTKPTTDPLEILWQQLKYNAWTEGYDLVLWLEAEDLDMSSPMFALYQSGRTVFLRIEYKGKNRVLDATFEAAELEEALEPYLRAR